MEASKISQHYFPRSRPPSIVPSGGSFQQIRGQISLSCFSPSKPRNTTRKRFISPPPSRKTLGIGEAGESSVPFSWASPAFPSAGRVQRSLQLGESSVPFSWKGVSVINPFIDNPLGYFVLFHTFRCLEDHSLLDITIHQCDNQTNIINIGLITIDHHVGNRSGKRDWINTKGYTI